MDYKQRKKKKKKKKKKRFGCALASRTAQYSMALQHQKCSNKTLGV
ncbi:hypothetical protein QG37_00360 [Candidozyma auris]|uniref:Uncharacterized protein n=1 Tax=Candidozyma auris TaxID=498019 RepID=A0A0L0P8M3_CANAR|nr:hypothetical protein QG37_00360 [[Candida] auris]